MRWLLAYAAFFVLAAPAQAGTLTREGTELVYRSAPGEADAVVIDRVDPGITAVRVLAADGDDDVTVDVPVPVFVELGPGDDTFGGSGPGATLAGGEGEDRIAAGFAAGTIDTGPDADHVIAYVDVLFNGPLSVLGGDGDDTLMVSGSTTRPGITVSGGPGDDGILRNFPGGPGIDIACGSGNDTVVLSLVDRPGAGCAPHLTGVAERRVGRTFRAGAVSAPATVAVEYRRRTGRVLARGRAKIGAGPVRVRLRPTRPGGLEPGRRLSVRVETRRGGERNRYRFDSRLG